MTELRPSVPETGKRPLPLTQETSSASRTASRISGPPDSSSSSSSTHAAITGDRDGSVRAPRPARRRRIGGGAATRREDAPGAPAGSRGGRERSYPWSAPPYSRVTLLAGRLPRLPTPGRVAIINSPTSTARPQVLDQVNVAMAPRAALNPPVLDVAGSTVEVGSLEAVRGNNHLCTATSPRLSLCRRKQSAPQASTAQVSADPQEFDVAATSPRPTRQPCFKASVSSSLRSAQQSSVVEPSRVGVELVDAIRESGVDSVVDVTDGDGIVGHDCMMTGLRRPRAVAADAGARSSYGRSSGGTGQAHQERGETG